MSRNYNWLALIAGVASLLLIVVSLFVPWWQITLGKPALLNANISPVNMNLGFLGSPLSIPLIWALNLSSSLSLAAGGIVLLIYSVRPTQSYSKRLLGFGWNKPLFAVVLFAVELIALALLPKALVGLNFPITGSESIQVPQSWVQGANVSVMASAGFEWPFGFAIVVAGLCVAARLYHRRVASPVPLQVV